MKRNAWTGSGEMKRTFRGTDRPSRALVLVALLLLVVVLSAAGGGCSHERKHPQLYHCPMHPTYVSDHPGDCPICGMRLVPMSADSAKTAGSPAGMGPDNTRASRSGSPGTTGAAPLPGSRSTSASPSTKGPRRILYYRSPMDPSVTSPVPAKDQMGMDYVPVYPDEVQPRTGIPDHAPVTVSEEGMRLAGIRTAPAARGTLHLEVRAVGSVTPDERRIHSVMTRVSGWVDSLYAGTTEQYVRQGQPLLRIDSPDLLASQTEYLEAQRAARSLGSSANPEARQGADDLVRSARQRLELFGVPESLIEELDRTGRPERDVVLPAPASGYLTVKSVLAGMRVEPKTEIFRITDLSEVWVEADFYEYEAHLLKLGQEAVITLPYDPGRSVTATVDYVYPLLDEASRTIRVRLRAPNPDLLLKPGMYANVSLAVDSAPGISVPDNAVMDTGERKLVFVQTAPGQFSPRAVEVGARGQGQALILSGLAEGDVVAIEANFLLDSESRIRAAFADDSDSGAVRGAPSGTSQKSSGDGSTTFGSRGSAPGGGGSTSGSGR